VKAEDRFVERLRAALAAGTGGMLVGPGDDAAVVERAAGPLVATTDALVESVDFLPEEDPERLGRRAVAVNLSDLAAMGARPEFFLLTIAFPESKGEGFPLAVARGAAARGEDFGARLAGGDLSRAREVFVCVALWGRPEAKPILRSGGRAGDLLFVSGWPGQAAAGLTLARRPAGRELHGLDELSEADAARLLAAYRDPDPRVPLGLDLARHELASAAIDVSDGLGIDAGRLARASGVRAVLERDRLPLSPALITFARLAGRDAVEMAIGGGDDYELLFSVPPSDAARVEERSQELGVPVRRIGFLEPGEGAFLLEGSSRRPVHDAGFDHFGTAR